MSSETLGQTLTNDVRRMAWVYPLAIAIAVALMAFQTISGVKVFTFERSPADSKPAEPKQFSPPSPQLNPDDIRRINDEMLVSQRRIDDLQKQLDATNTELASLTAKSASLEKKSEHLTADFVKSLLANGAMPSVPSYDLVPNGPKLPPELEKPDLSERTSKPHCLLTLKNYALLCNIDNPGSQQ
jgi:hypothetical protein